MWTHAPICNQPGHASLHNNAGRQRLETRLYTNLRRWADLLELEYAHILTGTQLGKRSEFSCILITNATKLSKSSSTPLQEDGRAKEMAERMSLALFKSIDLVEPPAIC